MHKRIRLNAAALAGLLIILFFLIIAVFAPVIAPYDPKEMIASYLPPSREHLLGTNDVGQDIFSEMVYGTRVSLYIGIFAAFIVTGVGTVLALVSGYFGGVTDKIITAITNIAMAVPSLPLTVLLVAYLNPGKWSLIIAISVTAWTGTARILFQGHAAEGAAVYQNRKNHGCPSGCDPVQTHPAKYQGYHPDPWSHGHFRSHDDRSRFKLSGTGGVRREKLGQCPSLCLFPKQHHEKTVLVVCAAHRLHLRLRAGLYAHRLLWKD